jgi:hypothetical protein
MLNQSLIKELEEKLETAKGSGGEFMVGLSWKDAKGELQHYFLQHRFSKAEIDRAWEEIRELTRKTT